ncbi:hypothetical protein GCM10023184_16900 [Flaviaesturariibacter amylovorans]|uniref:DUF4157 domain-containing protein n=1 Tax=Flaviaesturariibacter amylovorans TaxID=1084520 RepID=A0ABP8GNN6_9BACT
MLLSGTLGAQQFGGFPPATRWQQINTDTARIIFTAPAAPQAQRVASILHRLAATPSGLGPSLQKINVVLHGNTTLANGYVGLAPWRSEFYLIPGANIFDFGNLPWHEQLAIHEYRHVQQYNNMNRGLSRASGVLLGQEGRALANALSVPDWFFEGDAVYAETVLTPGGRGRMPYFFNGFNALWKGGRNYSWMKLRNGSYKDFVPNHYPLGYLLVNYGYQKYGADFWGKVVRDASAFKGLFYPFQKAVQRHSGVSFKQFRTEALASYRHEVSRRRDELNDRTVVTNFYFPQAIGTDSMLYLKDSYRSIPAFYLRTPAGERRIALSSISNEEWLNYRNGTVAYTAYSTHPRWSLVNYSDIVLLDVATGREHRITRKQKYFTPSLSPFDSTLVAVNINDSLQSELHLLSREGKLLLRRQTPARAFFIHPQFVDRKTIVLAIRHANAKVTLNTFDTETLKFTQLLPPTNAVIGFFYPAGDKVYFTASLNGTDDLYEISLATRAVNRLTTGGVGHYFPSVRDSVLTWSQFSTMGFRMTHAALDSLPRIEVPIGQWGLEQEPFAVAGADSAVQILDAPVEARPVTRYKGATGLVNPHSWRPYYQDPEFTFSVYSDNVLNTLSGELFYRYNQNEDAHGAGINLAYGGLFPVLTAGAEHTFERTVRLPNRTFTLSSTDLRLGYYVPLNFSQGKTLKSLRFGSDVVVNQTRPTGATKLFYQGFSATYLSHTVSWAQQLPQARQHIYPRLGYFISGNYRHRLDEPGYQFLASSSLYLPGIMRNHSLVLSGSFQQVDTNNVLFSNRFANSRGYTDFFNSRMWRYSGNYHFPILNPDRGLANIVYLLRVRGNLFYDMSRFYSDDKTRTVDLRSAGGELYLDTKWWNSYPVTLTFRYSYLIDARRVGNVNQHVFEFLFPVNLIPR